jgi:hypothetical protein
MTARKDTRPVVEFRECNLGWHHAGYYAWEAVITYGGAILSVGDYTRRASAKRGMVRFLRRLGADPSAVRWEGEV